MRLKLIDFLSLLASPCSTAVDLFEYVDDEGICIWTGTAGNLPAELHERTVQSFEPNSWGLNIDLN